MAMKTPLLDGETLIKEGLANMQRGLETAGGKLYLTDRRLIFEAHLLNIQSGVTVLDRGQITGTKPAWTRFLGLIPIFPNSLLVKLADGTEHSFVTNGRQAWIDAIGQRTA